MALSIRTLLFSDIEGSTPLLERAGAQYAELLGHHRQIVRAAVERAGGVEHGTEGDSFFVSFDTPSAGLAAAVEAQRALEEYPWPSGLRLRVRMGLHVGEVLEGDDVMVGMSINHAARIAATAHGGQIVVSGAVRDMVRTLPADVELRPLGSHRLRDVGSTALFQVDHPDLQHEFSDLRGVLGNRTNLPRCPTPLIGGDVLLASIAQQLQTANLVTLTGTGGVGKTRVAVEFGRQHLGEFDDGVFFVDLAPIADTAAVAAAVAATLPLVSGSGPSLVDAMVDWIGDRRLLLVVDNCEHVIAEVAALVDAVIAGCVNLKLIATSREALGAAGEHVLRVPSLDANGGAVELFRQRAVAADASFSIEGHADVVAHICARLDGIPLAIELAAARMRSLSPPELLERLEDRFRLLRGSGRGTLDRHSTLRATVSWSYQLLSETERVLFDRVSVFAGGFDLRAAETVCGFDPIDALDVIDLVRSLVDKSMIVAERGVSGMRYRLLETLRQFGEEQLELRDHPVLLRDRHSHHYAAVMAELDLLLRSARQNEGSERMSSEWDNLRSAHLWALAQRDLQLAERLTVASFQYATLRMRHEHATMIDRTVRLADELDRPSTPLLGMLTSWLNMQGDEAEALRVARRAIDVAPSLDHPATAKSWFNLAGASPLLSASSPEVGDAFRGQRAAVANVADLDYDWMDLVDLVDAADEVARPPLLQQLTEVAARVQAPRLVTFACQYEGHAFVERTPPDFASAIPYYERALELARNAADVQLEAMSLRAVALATTGLGRADALARCHDALDALYEIRYWQKTWQILDSVALALCRAGRDEDAAVVLGHLDAHVAACGLEHHLQFRRLAHGFIDVDGGHGAAALRGSRLSADELVAKALQYCSTAPAI